MSSRSTAARNSEPPALAPLNVRAPTTSIAYLFTLLSWTRATPLKLDACPAIQAYVARLLTRPSIAKPLGEEAEVAKQKAA